jgi:CheY-like chemotaxis protein
VRTTGHAGAPHVLLVEDDEEVRELLIDVLNSHGLRVTPVGSAEEALLVEAQHQFDLLLTDIGLPGATGPELAREVRRRSPRLPVLFISGQSGDIFEEDAQLDSPRGFLQKPFSSRALVSSLHELLKPQRD